MNRVGVSLPFGDLAAGKALGTDAFLEVLRKAGVLSVELRTVHPGETPERVLAAAERVFRAGMGITVHTAPRSAETALSDMLAPLRLLLPKLEEKPVILVLHPVEGGTDPLSENIRLMGTLTRSARRDALPVRFALENNRKMPDGTPGDSAALVEAVIRDTDPGVAGLTFDFGHYAWATRVWECPRPLPLPHGFAERVIHTHIHALAGPEANYTTHYPPGKGFLPLTEYLTALGNDYSGVFNIELSCERYPTLCTPEEALLSGIAFLKKELENRGYSM